jgi:hypothetical protein
LQWPSQLHTPSIFGKYKVPTHLQHILCNTPPALGQRMTLRVVTRLQFHLMDWKGLRYLQQLVDVEREAIEGEYSWMVMLETKRKGFRVEFLDV